MKIDTVMQIFITPLMIWLRQYVCSQVTAKVTQVTAKLMCIFDLCDDLRQSCSESVARMCSGTAPSAGHFIARVRAREDGTPNAYSQHDSGTVRF